jgi:hypothetical protein
MNLKFTREREREREIENNGERTFIICVMKETQETLEVAIQLS